MTASQKIFVLLACCTLLVAGCGSPAVAQIPTPTMPSAAPPTTRAATAQPTATTPPATEQPTATAVPSPQPAPTAVPAPRVGLQVGHWKLEHLPQELIKFRKWSGSYYRGYDEWEINMPIAQAVQRQLEAAGVTVDLLPAVIPQGYQADAFVSIHADGVDGAQAAVRHGWKLATPYRASTAADALAAAVEQSYPRVTGMPADSRGPSVDMRAYYAFAWYRYWHAIAPTTPAIIVETGFMTYPADWALLFKQPERVAQGISEGILAYLAANDRTDSAAREPEPLPLLKPKDDGTALHKSASLNSTVEQRLAASTRLVPLATRDGWYLVLTRGAWDIGWVRADAVDELNEPQMPITPKPDD